jgi:lysine 6-dehydrogenase
MGRAAAWDLARQGEINAVRLLDASRPALDAAREELNRLLPGGDAAIETRLIDLSREERSSASASASPEGLTDALGDAAVALSAADYRFNEAITRAAIAARTHLCDLGGNLPMVDRQLALDEEARNAGVAVIPDCGLAPGLACMLAAWGVQRMDTPERVQIRVGGLPAHPKPPLHYKMVFAARGLLNEYLEPAEIVRDGERHIVPSLEDPEELEFPAPFGRLEAFMTSGGSSTLTRTLAGRVTDLNYKTIRYPGHMAAFSGMQALGLLGEDEVMGISPRKLVDEHLTDDDTDVVLVRSTVEGHHEGSAVRLVFEIIDHHDDTTGHSAMARTTAYAAAAVAHLLATGRVNKRGVVPGELALPLADYADAVRARGIKIVERSEVRTSP